MNVFSSTVTQKSIGVITSFANDTTLQTSKGQSLYAGNP